MSVVDVPAEFWALVATCVAWHIRHEVRHRRARRQTK